MTSPSIDSTPDAPFSPSRRQLLGTGLALAAASLLQSGCSRPQAEALAKDSTPALAGGRKLGSLAVSSIGLGVQNMSRTYQTTIPSRPEMLNIIRTAFDRGVTRREGRGAYLPSAR